MNSRSTERRQSTGVVSMVAILGIAALLFAAGRVHPPRRRVKSATPRQVRNLVVAMTAGLSMGLLERPLLARVTREA